MRLPAILRRRASVPAVVPPEAEQRGAGLSELVGGAFPSGLAVFGWDNSTVTGESVTIAAALGVPAIWAAVNFQSRSMAALPVAVYQKTDEGREKLADHPVASLLNVAVHDECSSFDWRIDQMVSTMTQGRHVSYIERNARGEPVNIWPLETDKLQVQRKDNRTVYLLRDGSRTIPYAASDVIDLKFMPSGNPLQVRSPIHSNRNTIALAIAVTKFGGRFFNNGGVPPFAIEGPFESPAGMKRAVSDLQDAFREAADSGKASVAIPMGHKVHELGSNPDKMQMVEVKKFLVEEIARIYSMPPVFLQDLSHGTMANTEQQDLALVKHLLAPWAKQWEQEVNLKMFGRGPRDIYVEMSLDGVMRGDFKSMMEGFARGIMSGQMTPNETRRLRNLPDLPGGDELYMQGATVPLDQVEGIGNDKGQV